MCGVLAIKSTVMRKMTNRKVDHKAFDQLIHSAYMTFLEFPHSFQT